MLIYPTQFYSMGVRQNQKFYSAYQIKCPRMKTYRSTLSYANVEETLKYFHYCIFLRHVNQRLARLIFCILVGIFKYSTYFLVSHDYEKYTNGQS